MTAGQVGLVLGADSLMLRRSGVGRMTLEIATAMHGHADVAGMRLLLHGRLKTAEEILPIVEQLAARPGPSGRMSALQRFKLMIAPIPAVQHVRSARSWWYLRGDLKRLRAEWPSLVYHEPNMIPMPFDGTTVVTVNDLSWHHHADMHPRERIMWIGANLKRAFAQAARFVCISEFTAGALSSEFGIPRARIDVVPLAADAQFAPVSAADAAPALARHDLADRGYVLSVSTVEPRKNFDRLLAAHRGLPASLRQRFPLVIVGGGGWGAALATPDARAAEAEGSLRMLGHVPDADLVPLYARAALFAYVSLYEGFGLPLIEAMATGTAVVASSTTAVGETAGDAARLVDPLDPDAIRDALREVLEDEALADDLRARGARHAANFTWGRTADELLGSWRRALAA